MTNSHEIEKLNQLLGEIKILVGSFSVLDAANTNKDQISILTALDAVNFRVRAIHKLSAELALKKISRSSTNSPEPNNSPELNNSREPNNSPELRIEDVLLELSKPNPDAKILHALLDDQLETLRKVALSQILTLSID